MRTDKSFARLFMLIALVLAGLLVLAPGAAFADDDDGGDLPKDPEDPFPVKCVAKVVCGTVNAPGEGPDPFQNRLVGAGVYTTSVNILNIGTEVVDIQKKFVPTANPVDPTVLENEGLPSDLIDHFGLASMAGFDVDCEEIPDEFFASFGPAVAEGFLFIQSTGPIHVTAVYTAGQPSMMPLTECDNNADGNLDGNADEVCASEGPQAVQSIDVETIACQTVRPKSTCDSGECDD